MTTIHHFPQQPDRRPVPPYPPLERAVEAVEVWCERAQAELARLPGRPATIEDHRRLRALADELIARLLDAASA